nr:reverse transcriptase domain-containing protein [Tanacetum cinerariifolium]
LDASNEDCPEDRDCFRDVGESYDDSYSHSYHDRDRSCHMKRKRDNESMLSSVSKSDSSDERFHGAVQSGNRAHEGGPKCMRISIFMHGVNNPKLKKRLNEHLPKTMEEMVINTTAFIRGEAVVASKKKGGLAGLPPYKDAQRNSCGRGSDYIICGTQRRGDSLENFKVALHPDFPDQEVAIGGTLSMKRRTELCSLLKENLDILAWLPSDMTGIHLAESDEEKTAFHTGQRVYCYTKMPFDLKNAGAMYQRLVDKAFDSQIGQNIEAYVNDLVVKSHTEAEMLRDISETFRTFQRINIKLNPKNTLKKCIKKSDFHWTSDAEKAFKQLKQHLSELPLLVAPKPKEELIVYLSASYGVISAVLMTERGAIQMPVYFVSRALQVPKLNYTPMEKLVLSLIFTAMRLRSVMLVEHNITYRPRTSVKGQVLADFLAEVPDESLPTASVVETQQEPWTLFMDGSFCVDGSRAGLILTSPEGTEFTYALRF